MVVREINISYIYIIAYMYVLQTMRTMAVNFPETLTISFKAGPRCDCRYFYKVSDIVLNYGH